MSEAKIERRKTRMYYRSPEHAVEEPRSYFGPTMLTFDSLDEPDRERLHAELLDLHRRHIVATDGTMIGELEYVLAIASKT